jgi:ABC-type sugar transport system ATPase subunit
MSPAPAAISFDDVSKRYGENAAPVLDRVSLDVREREFLAVVGPSGSARPRCCA